jgi:hypothetical protein
MADGIVCSPAVGVTYGVFDAASIASFSGWVFHSTVFMSSDLLAVLLTGTALLCFMCSQLTPVTSVFPWLTGGWVGRKWVRVALERNIWPREPSFRASVAAVAARSCRRSFLSSGRRHPGFQGQTHVSVSMFLTGPYGSSVHTLRSAGATRH